MAANAKTFTISEVAEMIETSPRTIRKVLRAIVAKDAQPGKGGRWVIREKDIETLREKVNAFSAKSATVAEFGE